MSLKHTLFAGAAIMTRGPMIAFSPDDDGGGASAPAAETENPAPEAPEGAEAPEGQAAGETPASEVPEGGEQPAPDEPKKPKSPVAQLQGRVGHLTKQLHEKDADLNAERSRREALEALFAAQGKNPDGTDAPAPKPATPSATLTKGSPEWNEAVKAEARQLAAAESFTNQCNAIFDEGAKKHGDIFKEGVANLNALGLMDANLVNAAIATGAAPDVLNALGSDVDEAQRIAALQPVQMGVELAKLAGKLQAPKAAPQVSRAPAPITPVGSSVKGDADIYDPKLSDEDYYARRKAMGAKFVR